MKKRSSGTGLTLLLGSTIIVMSALAPHCQAQQSIVDNPNMAGFEAAFGFDPKPANRKFDAKQIDCSAPANVFWPHDIAAFAYEIKNLSDAPLAVDGKLKVMSYRFVTDPENIFGISVQKVADINTLPVHVELAAKGATQLRVTPEIPETFGAYILILDLGEAGQQSVSACVRTLPAKPGRVKNPAFALDMGSERIEMMQMFKRLGIKGARFEYNYPGTTDSKEFYRGFARLAGTLRLAQEHDITVMLTIEADGNEGAMQPAGHWRPHLTPEGVMLNTKSDMTVLPQFDEDFQKYCKIIASTFGFPNGNVNAMELWNEPWEGISISGWGADMPRYRELFTRMAMGVDEARKEGNVQVLTGGCCSSMNTFDKLFSDGKDTFLPYLDFVSMHYEPLGGVPSLVPEWINRKSPRGRVQSWDTESWLSNSDDLVLPVIASMRAQDLTRTSGVCHDYVRDIKEVTVDKTRITQIHAMAPAVAIAATQNLIGERAFREILFPNGLPWVFTFDSQPRGNGKTPPPYSNDAVMVVVGDLSYVYPRERLLFRGVKSTKEMERAAEVAQLNQDRAAIVEKQTLKANGGTVEETAEELGKKRKSIDGALRKLHVVDGTMSFADGGGKFMLRDYYGNLIPSKNGQISVPLNGLGFFLSTDGSKGSFAELVDAVKSARIDGYSPLDIAAHDLLQRVEAHPALRLTLTNILNRPVSGNLSVKLGGCSLESPEQAVQLAAHETREVVLKVADAKSEESNTYPLSLVFDAGADGKALHEESLHVNVIARRTINVDGNLDDWKDILPQPIHAGASKGPNLTEQAWKPFETLEKNEASGFANGYLAYDDDFFYFAAKIADNTPDEGNIRFETRDEDSYYYPDKFTQVIKDPKTGEEKRVELSWPEGVRHFSYRRSPELPSGNGTDNVQIAFNVVPQAEKAWLDHPPGTMSHFMAYACTDYEYALNTVSEKFGGGTELWRLLAPGVPRKHFYPREPAAPIDGGPVKNGKLVTRRDGNTRIVECALPWSELPLVKKQLDAAKPIKFSFRVNDNKGQAYELAGQRSVSKVNTYSFHDYWVDSWANEIEFSFEK